MDSSLQYSLLILMKIYIPLKHIPMLRVVQKMIASRRNIYDLIDESMLEMRADMRKKKREDIDIEWDRDIIDNKCVINVTIRQDKNIVKTKTIIIYSDEYHYIFHYITCYLAELLSI